MIATISFRPNHSLAGSVIRPTKLAGAVIAALLISACAAPAPPSATPFAAANPGSSATTSAAASSSVEAPTPGSSATDGDWLLFEWFADRSVKDIMLMRPDGSERHAIATDAEPDLEHADATWSPDGKTIAFDVGASYDGMSIWTVPIDGRGATRLIGPDDRCRLGVALPSYSPDGRRLMYACQDGMSGTSSDVHETLEIIDLASGDRTSVVTLRGQQELFGPTWSRDGATAVFTVDTWAADLTTQRGSFIATVPIAGGEITPLTDADTWSTDPRWSPIDDRIVFATHGYGVKDMSVRSTIATIRPDGSDLRTIWPGTDAAVGRVAAPRWTPDGDHLIVSVATGTDTIADIHPASLTLDGQLDTIAAPMSGVAWTPRPRP